MLSATVFGALLAMVNLAGMFDSTAPRSADSTARARIHLQHIDPDCGQMGAPWYRVDGEYGATTVADAR